MEKTMCDNDIQLIMNIFLQILPPGEVESSHEYLERHKQAIKAAGRELKFLRLAEPDEKSPFGWRPTKLLIKFVAERVMMTGNSRRRLCEASSMYHLLRYAGYRKGNICNNVLSHRLLIALGLNRPLGGQDWVTSDLHRLLCEGYRVKIAERIARRNRRLYGRRHRRDRREGDLVAQQAGAERFGDGTYVVIANER
jgi:hypothetical protein